MLIYLLYPSVVPVARHRMFPLAVARLHKGPRKTSMVPIESLGYVYWG